MHHSGLGFSRTCAGVNVGITSSVSCIKTFSPSALTPNANSAANRKLNSLSFAGVGGACRYSGGLVIPGTPPRRNANPQATTRRGIAGPRPNRSTRWGRSSGRNPLKQRAPEVTHPRAPWGRMTHPAQSAGGSNDRHRRRRLSDSSIRMAQRQHRNARLANHAFSHAPKTIRLRPPRPCVGITIKSEPNSLAAFSTSLDAEPVRTTNS